MNLNDYYFTKNGIKISYDDFLLELRKMYKTELAYTKAKENLLYIMERGVESWNTVSRVHLRMVRKKHICPKCGNIIKNYPALSRRNNQTEICSNCGTLEAIEDFIKFQKKELKGGFRNGRKRNFG